MQNKQSRLTRRDFLKAMGLGAAGTVAAGWMGSGLASKLLKPVHSALAATISLSLVATDGYITMPNRNTGSPDTDPIYAFGFHDVTQDLIDNGKQPTDVSYLMTKFKGHTQHTAPVLGFKQNDDIKITLTNLGLVQRPDLTDSHTIHWHGFDIPSPLNDGVPEVSVAVPIGKQLTYFYRPHREGTYMYHCHFEDVEHVHMGMTSIVFVTPLQDGTPKTVTTPSGPKTFTKFAYNDTDGSTGYDRHFAFLENEIWSKFHDHDRDIQETIMTDYDPEWFTLNGRAYPDTLRPNNDATFTTYNPNYGTQDMSQPNSSLMQVNGGDRVLIRLANLGYRQNSMELPGIPMHVIGQDASLLRNSSVDTSYWTNTLYIGPGEARDVLFDAPAYNASLPSGSDAHGSYNIYYFKNRDWRKLSNNGAPGAGGMMTEVRVYQSPLPAQTVVNQTYV